MSNNKTILLIDTNVERSEKMTLLLEFIGEDVVQAGSESASFTQHDPENLLCVIVGGDAPAQLLLDIDNWNRYVPLLIVGVEELGFNVAPVQQQVLGCFKFPPNINHLTSLIHQCQVCRFLQYEGRQETRLAQQIENFVGLSQPVLKIRQLIAQVAGSESSVLITGESGTGKEVVARNLHLLSKRCGKPFVPVNCGAIPGELLESELFGHEKGAFTGAISARQGRFELAQGGTLFLDEIGDMPLTMQVKLLRVLQEKTFERVGSNKTIQADVRIIAATHRNLEQFVEQGKFREDLYYRLNVFPIELPSLREREDDIPVLVNEFVRRFEASGEGKVRLSQQSIDSLKKHRWPGNIRELANLIERLIILYPSRVVDIEQLPKKYQHGLLQPSPLPDIAKPIPEDAEPVSSVQMDTQLVEKGNFDLKAYLAQLELNYISNALEKSDWVVARAAESLGMRRTTLVEKMKKYAITRDEGKAQISSQ